MGPLKSWVPSPVAPASSSVGPGSRPPSSVEPSPPSRAAASPAPAVESVAAPATTLPSGPPPERSSGADHPRIVGLPTSTAPRASKPTPVATRQPHLQEPLQTNQCDQGGEEPPTVYHSNSTNSEQKPGPMASSIHSCPVRVVEISSSLAAREGPMSRRDFQPSPGSLWSSPTRRAGARGRPRGRSRPSARQDEPPRRRYRCGSAPVRRESRRRLVAGSAGPSPGRRPRERPGNPSRRCPSP